MQAGSNRWERHPAIVAGELAVGSAAGTDRVHQLYRYVSGLFRVSIDGDYQSQRHGFGRCHPLHLSRAHASYHQHNHNGLRKAPHGHEDLRTRSLQES
jgi:hypothetical protein